MSDLCLMLAIDTAQPHCSVAIMDQSGRLLSTLFEPEPHQQAAKLVGMIEAALEEAGLPYTSLSRLAVVIGPGSFTGIRIGIATAKALKLALTIPLYGLTSLEVLAEQQLHASTPDGPFFICQDASRGQCYLQQFTQEGHPLTEPLLLTDTDTAWMITHHSTTHHPVTSPPTMVAGSGAQKLAALLPGHILPPLPTTALAPWVCRRFLSYAQLGLTPRESVEPLYIREANAKPNLPHQIRT